MKTIEIIYGDSLNHTMRKSKLSENEIIKLDTPFSIADLSKIDEYKIILPKEIYDENIILDFSEEIDKINKLTTSNNILRVWTSHQDADSYILLSYIANYIKNLKSDLYVIYSDEFNREIKSPSMMRESELERISEFTHKLSKEEIEELSLLWNKIVTTKADMRINENDEIKLVSYDYFDNLLIEKLKIAKEEKIISLAADMLSNYHLTDTIFVFLIERLINKNKIIITKKDEVFCRSIVKVNEE